MLRSILSPSNKVKEVGPAHKIAIIPEYDESTFENDSYFNTNLGSLHSEPLGEDVLREKIRNFLLDIGNAKKPAVKKSTTGTTPRSTVKLSFQNVAVSGVKNKNENNKSTTALRQTTSNLKGLQSSKSKVQIKPYESNTATKEERRAKTPHSRPFASSMKNFYPSKTPEKSLIASVIGPVTSIQKKITPLGPKLKAWSIKRSITPIGSKIELQ
eukprot:TRINITY_DN831_c0_g3_i1.p1 TRINITY_DN831_c0_g3~~TRINITY_DN831_c0_g3_i1.p1  ORF type:complete len:213 (-),score=20.63 TRINITY_DN831_c0_g3_i1:37-675(-)